jgi:O-antigen ligase
MRPARDGAPCCTLGHRPDANDPYDFPALTASAFTPDAPAGAPPHPAVRLLLGAALVAPWLWPWAPGPSSQVGPLLAAWACILMAAACWLAWPMDRPQAAKLVARTWLTAALVSAVMGLLQWFGWAADLPGVQPASVGEAFGNLRQRNQYATLQSIGLLAVLYGHATRRGDRSAGAWHLAAALLALGMAASVSRTGAIQWVLIGGLALVRRESRAIAITALAGYGAGVLALPVLLQVWQGVDAPSLVRRIGTDVGCQSRRVLWANVLQLIGQRPWTGWGAGELDYAHFATLYPGARFCDILDNAHNLPLHLAVEFGIPAAVAVCSLLGWLVLRGQPWRERDPARVMAWGALGAIALHSLLEYPLWYGPFQLAVLLAAALLWPVQAIPRQGRMLGLGAIALLAAGLVWAAACYERVSQAYLPPDERRPGLRLDPLQDVRPGPFSAHAAFAELALTPLHPGTARRVHGLARDLLHFSPEPKVITARIESSVMLGADDDAQWHLARFKAAFPREHAEWAAKLQPAH